ncbi:MAG TPA: MOSC N-terminal beta barrel domain-containing protein [Rhodopila sp.]|jgi:hypothetical protein|nr:MOSC N-terminal beta barrel domain-containing protein [Rhodopila sp.]
MRIEYLYRFPVKGLTAEALEQAEVEAGGAIPWDRVFALAQGDSGFDPAHPVWLPKWNFLCQMKHAKAALLFSVFDPGSRTLRIKAPDGSEVEANAMTAEGRARIGAFLTAFLGEEARGQPTFQYVPNHVFADQDAKVISLGSLSSLRDYEEKVGARRHRRRFRANVWFSGAAPWVERDWVGRELQIGGAVVRVVDRTTRCPATEVNPETGERDANPPRELRSLYGHVDFGVHAEVISGGRFSVGDAVELMEP